MKILAIIAVVIVLCVRCSSGPVMPAPELYEEMYYSGEKIEE